MNRMSVFNSMPRVFRAGLAALLVGLGMQAQAATAVTGWDGEAPTADNGNARTFTLTAKQGFISTSDGNSHYAWGYAHSALPMQYPGPTLIVNQGETVKIVLNNSLPVQVSMLFPGQQNVTATGGNSGLLTREARAVNANELAQGAAVGGPTYTFVADNGWKVIVVTSHRKGSYSDIEQALFIALEEVRTRIDNRVQLL